jgi:pilus assembly protein CpaF
MSNKKHRQKGRENPQIKNPGAPLAEAPQIVRPVNLAGSRNLFFAPDDSSRDFGSVLREVQEYISSKYSTLIIDGGGDEVKTSVSIVL